MNKSPESASEHNPQYFVEELKMLYDASKSEKEERGKEPYPSPKPEQSEEDHSINLDAIDDANTFLDEQDEDLIMDTWRDIPEELKPQVIEQLKEENAEGLIT